MNRNQIVPLFALILALGAASSSALEGFTDDNETPIEPFVLDKSELFRFSRSAKGGLFAKYEQRQQEKQQQQEVANIEEKQSPQVEVVSQQVATNLPSFGEVDGSQQLQQVEVQQQQQAPAAEVPLSPPSESASSSSSSSSSSKSSNAKKVTTTTTTTTTTVKQEQPRIARLQEVRVHTIPLSEAVHYANYVVVPSSAGTKAANLEESSSSSSHRSSSASSREDTESIAVAPAPAPPATVVLPPAEVPLGPDCNVLQRLVIERPLASSVVLQVPSEVSVSSSSSSSSHSARVVEAAAPQPAFYIRRVVSHPVVTTARLVAPVSANDGHLKEEHFRSESRSLREESNGLHGHSSSTSSSASSSSSRSSKSTTTSQTATLLAPPAPPTVQFVHRAAPLVAVKAAAPVVSYIRTQPANSYSVDVDHHYTGPNVKYGYSIKQQSVEPETKGVVVGERVVYLK